MTVEKLATVAGFATVDTVVALLDVVVVTLTLLVIVGRRKSAHVTLAWILVVVTFPFVGPLLWFLLAGRRIRRVGRRKRLSAEAVRARLATLFGSRGSVLPADASVLALAGRLTGLPATAGNRLELLTENDEAFRELIASPSGSLTVGITFIFMPIFRSEAIFVITAACCASFCPK